MSSRAAILPHPFTVRFNAKDRILEVARGSYVAATFGLDEGRAAEAEKDRLNYAEIQREQLAADLADEAAERHAAMERQFGSNWMGTMR